MKTSDCFFRRGGVIFFFAGFFLIAWSSKSAVMNSGSSFIQRVWQSDQGLPHDSVHAILQTRDGYLWVGTRNGVARFDGASFTILKLPNLRKQNVSSLCEDRDGNLWIATESGVIRVKDGRISHYDQTHGLAGDNVRTIYEGKNGTIWIGTATGLSQFRHGKFRSFGVSEGLASGVIRSLCEDDQGNLWIATDGGLTQGKDGIFSIPESAKELGKLTRFVHLDQKKNLWVGTQTGLFRKKEDGWVRFDNNQGGLSDDFINTIYSDRAGQLWIGTYGGLSRLVDGNFVHELTSEGTAYDLVNSIMEDQEGSFWIGSKEGLTRLKSKPFKAITKQQGLTYNNVMSILEDKTGTFWCGTWGGGIFQLKDENIVAITTGKLGNNRVLSLCNGQDGSLWFGMDFGEGLYQLKNGDLTHFGENEGLEKIAIRVIHEDHEGNLWFGTSFLNLFKDGKFTRYTATEGFIGGTVRVILEDKESSLWIGTTHGLSRRKNAQFTNFTTKDGLSHDAVLALHEDKEKNLWIGTGGGGLNRMRNGQFTNYTTREGLFNDEILEILEDDHGYLWMSCLKGIFRVSKEAFDRFDRKEIDSIPCASYGKDDGMVSIICNNVSKPAAWKSSDGRLWFATTKGLVVADPGIKPDDTPPPVIIEKVLADKNPVESRGSSVESRTAPVTIPPGRGELEIHYTALSFRASEKNRFKYKLEGVDTDWVEAANRRVAYYNNLRPGRYSFRVTACNNNGVWNASGSNIQLVLQPHYWQTWWFQSLIASGCLSLAVMGTRSVIRRRLALKLQRFEQQHAIEKERTRIAQDMHDDLGSTLTRIKLLSELAEADKDKPEALGIHIRKISVSARKTVQALDETVWAVNPKNDTIISLVRYISHYANEFFEGSHIRCRLEMPTELPADTLSAELRHNLFLVVKEALNNVLKHSSASEARIQITVESALEITITDNGHGFDAQQRSDDQKRSGLENMRRRVEASGGEFEIQSQPGKGTRLKLSVEANAFLKK